MGSKFLILKVIEETFERIIVGNYYSDLKLGTYIVRGENILLMGDVVSINLI
jgi:hypothetical protein